MKKVLYLGLLAGAALFCQPANAKIFRVGYQGPHVSGTDFNDLSGAVAAAAANDTVQLYQNSSVGSGYVDKRLVFVGFGYRLQENPGLQAVPSVGNDVGIYFLPGSDSSIVQGVTGNFYIAAENVTLSRVKGSTYLGYNGWTGAIVNLDRVSVLDSYIDLRAQHGIISNAFLSNNIIPYMDLTNANGLFANNVVISYNLSFGGCVVKNNIFTYPYSCASGNSTVFQNNLFAASCPSTPGAGNQFNVDMNAVFEDWNGFNSGGSESLLALKAGSPAIGAGVSGTGAATDCGVYGGEPGHVYRPGGIPAIPSIYQLSAPQVNASTNPYPITIGVRSNN
ncbi:MAG: hypothetical protein EOO11_01240 [Chitinophagaceae bacterium]|nr:MAG: hypothetical protein EOO11_01240 [Chitinophagaceae bacterium]